MSAYTRAERETVVVWTEMDDQVSITSSSPHQIARLRADGRFTETRSRFTDGETVEFLIAVADFTLTKAAKRRLSQKELDQRTRNMRAIHGAA
ncbi:hypothetical protein [Brachybacterium sp. AOP29-B2-41]|uniref:hypothetical protein n=1 Tax=Brachybacterium sp. AOP29-B2-41 TaxID=3457704 RepID=UPI004033F1AF